MMPAIARRTPWDVSRPPTNANIQDLHLMSMRGTAHIMNPPQSRDLKSIEWDIELVGGRETSHGVLRAIAASLDPASSFFCKYVLIIPAECFGSLSCCKMKFRPIRLVHHWE